MKALVTGATGLLGRRLVPLLQDPRILARDASPEGHARRDLGVSDVRRWDVMQPLPQGALDGVDVVFHLAGAPIAGGRMTAARKAEIRDSRVQGTRHVVDALRGASDRRPRVLVSGSAVGIYGSRGDETLTEESHKGEGFLADVCEAWEREALAAREAGVRVVCARTGIVLAREGGALAAMRPAFLACVGGPLGSGEQWMPWIHIADVVGLLLHAARSSDVAGALNLTAPNPETNRAFTKTLAHALHRPAIFRVPTVALRLLAGDLADVVTASQRALPAKARATGYPFRFETLGAALHDLERKPATKDSLPAVAS